MMEWEHNEDMKEHTYQDMTIKVNPKYLAKFLENYDNSIKSFHNFNTNTNKKVNPMTDKKEGE